MVENLRNAPVQDAEKPPAHMMPETKVALLPGQKEPFPVQMQKDYLQKMMKDNDTSIVVAGTGAGKSRFLPQFAMELLGPGEKMIVTQPLRDVTEKMAERVAEDLGVKIGQEVGYQMKDNIKKTDNTKLTFSTDGLLLSQIRQDELLKDYSMVMIDEVHERSINIDVTMALLKRAQKLRKEKGMPPLKIVLTSATVDAEKLQKYFPGAEKTEIEGKAFGYKTEWAERDYGAREVPAAAAEKVDYVVNKLKKNGNILIFMSGQDSIDKTKDEIDKLNLPNTEIVPYSNNMTEEEQKKIFAKYADKRVIFIATNKAETGLTIDNLRVVIDSGYAKRNVVDPQTGVATLKEVENTQAGSWQRGGRVGRLQPAPGEQDLFLPLYTEDNCNKRYKFIDPEIKRENLTKTVLDLAAFMTTKEMYDFDFLDKPDQTNLHHAIESLTWLGALDTDGKLTEIGKAMMEAKIEPHMARAMVAAVQTGQPIVEDMATIAAMLEDDVRLRKPSPTDKNIDLLDRFKTDNSDFHSMLRLWNEFEKQGRNPVWGKEHGLSPTKVKHILETRKKLLDAMKDVKNLPPIEAANAQEAMGKALTAGYVDQLLDQSHANVYRFIRTNTQNIQLDRSSSAAKNPPDLAVVAYLSKTNFKGKEQDSANRVHPVKLEWVREFAPQLFKEEAKTIRYDQARDQVLKNQTLKLKDSAKTTYAEAVVGGHEAAQVLAQEMIEGRLHISSVIEQNKQIIARINDSWKQQGKNGPIISEAQLQQFWAEQLEIKQITSKKELEEALAKGEINLMFAHDMIISNTSTH